jgi:hypothetical protein
MTLLANPKINGYSSKMLSFGTLYRRLIVFFRAISASCTVLDPRVPVVGVIKAK